MICVEPSHKECFHLSGPFMVYNVDTKRRMHQRHFHSLGRAFDWADRAVRRSGGNFDYVIHNQRGDRMRRPPRA